MLQENNYQQTVLLVDDEEHILTTSSLYMRNSGIQKVLTLLDCREVIPLLEKQPISVIVLDLQMPYLSGQELLQRIIHEHPQTPVILMTANDDIETVVSCIKAGAFDYLVKPVESNQLVSRVKKALEIKDLSNELTRLKQRLLTGKLEHPEVFSEIITCNTAMKSIFQYVEVVAKTRQPITVTGETGVGKELIAKAIHDLSDCTGDFVPINVAGLDDNMFSDTLFGHCKGAFTGADHMREGLVKKAAKGTLFLDEIGDLNDTSQVKLLRLLQEQEYYPVGSDLLQKSDVRIVLATNRDIQTLTEKGTFRKDLYYRLFAHRVQIPPLRERPDDIPLLLEHFLETSSQALKKKKPTAPQELATLLTLYEFPGNIRELEALTFDAVARHSSGILSMESFSLVVGERQPVFRPTEADNKVVKTPLIDQFCHFPSLAEVEKYMIGEAMKLSKGNQGMAAKLLGIGRQTLNKKLQKEKGA